MKKPIHLLFAVIMLFLFGLAVPTKACPPPDCPPCEYSFDGQTCDPLCAPEYCCGNPLKCQNCCDDYPDQCSSSYPYCKDPYNINTLQCVECVSIYDCHGCERCDHGTCVDSDLGCTGDCEVCENGLCFPNQDKCPGNCESCEWDDDNNEYNCKDNEDRCPGDCYNCFFGTCEEQSYLCGACGECVNHNCKDIDANCPNACFKCVDGHCVYCDDETEVCCDDGCKKKCQETTDSSSCNESKNQSCVACSPEGSLCDEISTQIIYTGISFTRCEEKGCDNHCWQSTVLCAIETPCTEDWPLPGHACAVNGEGEFYCKELPPELILWPCKRCKPVEFGSNIFVDKGHCVITY